MKIPNDIVLILCIIVGMHIMITWALALRRGWKARKNEVKQLEVSETELPPVSVIVPAWNEKGTIEKCIGALQNIKYPEWEAIIMAGGRDGTYEEAILATKGDNRFQVIERGPEPKNMAIAKGIEYAKNDILVLLDADSMVFPEWLRRLTEPIVSGAGASFGMHFPSKQTWISLYEHMEHTRTYQIQGSRQAAGCASQAIRRNVLNRIGPLPANAYSWEDWDIDVRLMKIGERNVFVPEARLFTDRPTTLSEYWHNLIRCQRSHLAGLWFHRDMILINPVWGFTEILFYVISFGVALALFVGLIVGILRPVFLPSILTLLSIGLVWILGRSAVLAAEIAAFKGDLSWLNRAWSPPILLPIQFAASVVAVLGSWKQPHYDYKGQREFSVIQK